MSDATDICEPDKVRWRGSKEPYIRMYNLAKFNLANPKPEDWLDVAGHAYHLAGINRYTGASRFSIAQHMVVGARMAERFYPDNALLPARFMIHDYAESVYGDMSSPLKSMCPDYKHWLEVVAEPTVEKAFDLLYLGVPEVKELDYRMWLTERLTVFPLLSKTDDYGGALEPFPLTREELEEHFGRWSPEKAEAEYLFEFRRLLPWVQW